MARRDLFIFQNAKPPGMGEAKITFAVADGEGVTGIQKIAQVFTMLLLTDRGSCPTDANKGTNFYRRARSGYIRDDNTLQSEFGFAVIDIMNYLADNRDSLIESERLAQAELTNWNYDKGSLRLYVRLTSAAGTQAVYSLPEVTGV